MLCASSMLGVIVSAILLSTLADVAYGRYVLRAELQRAIVHKKMTATWDEAKVNCENEGAMLASPVDSDLLEYMKSSIGVNNHTTPYFIGMRLFYDPGHTVIESVEGIPLEDLPQDALDMIEQIDPQDGDCLIMNSHEIRTGPCLNRLPYICYKNSTAESTSTTTSTTTSAPTTTPEVTTETTTETTTEITTTETPDNCTTGGYVKLSTGYYKLHTSSYRWELADKTCTEEGAYLVVLNNEEEARVITDFAFPAAQNSWVLIGITVISDDWHSVNDEPMDQLYNKWVETHNPEEKHIRGALYWDGLLDDMSWGYSYPFVCEKPCT